MSNREDDVGGVAGATQLRAGRELDALVAEKVMGWRNPREWWPWPESQVLLSPFVGIPPHRAAGPVLSDVQHIPEYSTDIAAAWQVVEKMRADGVYIDVSSAAWGFKSTWGHAGEGDEDIWVYGDHWKAETAPLAICRAALKAIAERSEAQS